MRKKIIDGHLTYTAKEGYFVATADLKVWGKTLSLGYNTTKEDLVELPESEFPEPEPIEDTEI